MLQSGAPAAAPDPPPAALSCEPASANADTGRNDVVVCGRRDQDRYPLPKLPSREEGFRPLETSVGGNKVGITTEKGEVGGIPTNRVMLKIRIPL